MKDTENQNENVSREEPLYSEKDFDEYKANLQNEFLEKENQMKKELEDEAKKANMSELELALNELEELKKKYQEKEDECLITKQKEETNALLEEAGLSKNLLELVYAPKDMEATKEKIEILKAYIEDIKKEIFQNYSEDTPVPSTSKQEPYDPFVEGFDTNVL